MTSKKNEELENYINGEIISYAYIVLLFIIILAFNFISNPNEFIHYTKLFFSGFIQGFISFFIQKG